MNLRRIKDLSVDSLVYGFGTVATKAIGFLMIPIYTRYLSPADYGVLALVSMFGLLVGLLIGLGQHSAVFRYYFKYGPESPEREQVVSTFFCIAASMVVPCAALAALSAPIAGLLLGDASLAILICLVLTINYLELVQKVPIVIMRARRWTGRYFAFTVSRTLLTISLILLFVVGLRRGVFGVLAGQTISAVVFCIALYALLRPNVRLRFSRLIGTRMLRFGLPLVPGLLLHYLIRFSNRYFLQMYSTLDDVGLYSLGSRFGEIIEMLNFSIQTAWPIFLYDSEKEAEAPALYARAITYYLVVAIAGGTALILFIPEVYTLMVAESFHGSMQVVPLVVVAFVFNGVYLFGQSGINLREKTHYHLVSAGVALIASVVLHVLLVPRFGIMGAGAATVLSYAVLAALTVTIAQRLYPIPWEIRRIVTVLVVFAAVGLAGRTIPWPGLAAGIAGKLLLLLAAAGALAVARFLTADERATIRRALGSWRSSRRRD